MNDQPIYLEASEEITSVIDRLRQSGGKSVTFVVPAGATLIQSIVNLKLLKRAAAASGKSVEIVTGDRMGRNLAAQVGFTVFGSLEDLKASKPFKAAALPKTPPKAAKADGIVAAEPAAKPVKMTSRPVPEELPEEVPSPTPESKPAKAAAAATGAAAPASKPGGGRKLPSLAFFGAAKSKKGMMIGGGLVLLLLVILLVTYVFASATITITPKADPADTAADVTASKDVQTVSESGTMPAQVVSADEQQSGSFQATGQKDIGSKASGTVNVTNCVDSNSHTLPAGSALTSGSATFVSNSAATIPPAGVSGGKVVCSSPAAVSVTATQAGSQYNVSGAGFSVPALGMSGTGTTSGGSTKTVTVISQDDLDKAKASLSDKVKSSAIDELKKKLSPDQPVLDGATSVDVSSFTPSAPAGTQTDNFTAQENGTATLLTYHKGDLKQLLVGQIQGKVAAGKQVIAPESGIQTTVVSVDAKSGTLRLHATLNGFVADKFDTAALAESVKGKSITDARKSFLNHSDIAETEISVWPSYKGRLPFFANKITIKIATPKTNP